MSEIDAVIREAEAECDALRAELARVEAECENGTCPSARHERMAAAQMVPLAEMKALQAERDALAAQVEAMAQEYADCEVARDKYARDANEAEAQVADLSRLLRGAVEQWSQYEAERNPADWEQFGPGQLMQECNAALAALLAQTREAERERCIKECAEAVERLWAGDAEIPFREAVVDMLNDMLVQRPEAEK